jgi:hypothetical protein
MPHEPFYWKYEQTGMLALAVKAYLDRRHSGAPLTGSDIALLRQYLAQWINAPCWLGPSAKLDFLREVVNTLDSSDKISAWLNAALDIGIDPL